MKFVGIWQGLPRVTRLWFVVACAAFSLILPAMLLPPLVDRLAAFQVRVNRALETPSASEWFGTDPLGRSLWNRTLAGAGISLRIVSGALAIAFPLSLVLGTIAGACAGRWPDQVISWIISLLYTVPFFLVVVALSAVAAPGVGALPWIIGGVIWAAPARVVRSEAQRITGSAFVRQERAIGIPPLPILMRTVLPVVTAPVAISLLYLVPEIIGIDAVLSLFGLGAQPPEATLGTLIYEGLRRWDAAPWLTGLPTLFLCVYALCIHSLADRLSNQLRSISAG